jgi:hypothetical protein
MSTKPASEVVSEALYGWLDAEVKSSGQDLNSYLDDHTHAIDGLKSGWEHPDNSTAQKFISHMDRFPIWWEAFAYNPDDDYQAARIMFNGLMQVSGTFRDQCYLQASNNDNYLNSRADAVGVNIYRLVEERLKTLLPSPGDFTNADIDIEKLNEQRTKISDIGEFAIRRICIRANMGYDLEEEDSISVKYMELAQRRWLEFAVDCVAMYAKTRSGNLSAVPFLEPKSISAKPAPKVIYPLDSSFEGF